MKITIFIFGFILFSVTSFASGLKGTYTIDPSKAASATNYTSFNDADSDLVYGSRSGAGTASGPGVRGAVVFSIADGSYNEILTIPSILGASAKNTITFQSASKDSTKVILWDSTTASIPYTRGYVLDLNSAAFIHFNQITIQRTNTPNSFSIFTYDDVVSFENQADSNVFSNCRIIGNYTSPFCSNMGALVEMNSTFYGYTSAQYNTFYNNYMKDGNSAFDLFGGYASFSYDNIIDHNTIDSIGYIGFSVFMQDHVTVTNNKLNMPWGGYGGYIFEVYARGKLRSLFANNFISIGESLYGNPVLGIYATYVDSINFVYNNVNVYGSSAQGSAAANINAYYSTNALNVFNNNFYNQGKNHFDYSMILNNVTAADYNNVVCGGDSLVQFNGKNYSTLKSWRKASLKFAKHDTSEIPLYTSNYDLHIHNPLLNGTAEYLSYDTTDIDGHIRNHKTPDMGASEIVPDSIHPAIRGIVHPVSGICSGTQDVHLLLYNYGSDTIISANINWTVNGISQTAFSWKGSIAPGGHDTLDIGSYNFTGLNTFGIYAYADSANGISTSGMAGYKDSVTVYIGMKGNYSIDNSGKGSPDYTNIRSAVNDINARGLCGAVVFNIADGVYHESIVLNALSGSSAINTVTFQSASLDSSKVIIDSNAVYPKVLFQLNGSSYVTLRKLTFSDTANVVFNSEVIAVSLDNFAHHITVENNVVRTNVIYGNNSYGISQYYGSVPNHLNIRNNHVSGGLEGIGFSGYYYYYYSFFTVLFNYEKDVRIENNILDGFWNCGIIVEVADSVKISGNKLYGNSADFGIYGYYNNQKDTFVVSNNFVDLQDSGKCGLMIYECHPVNVYANSVVSASPLLPTVYISNFTPAVVNVMDNIFANTGGDSVMGVNIISKIKFDYNDYYTSGPVLGNWNGITCAKLNDWKKKSKGDVNSLSVNPGFKSVSTGDLHLSGKSFGILNKGLPITSVLYDIDGNARSRTPDIGADETRKYNVDAGIPSLDSPVSLFCAGVKDVYARVQNYGKDSLKSVTVNWSLNGTAMTPYSWSGKLPAFSSALVKIGSITFTIGKIDTVIAWTSNPNGIADSNTSNDTVQQFMRTGFSGTYTIGGVKPDFPNFRTAVNSLTNYGLCGAVVFNVRDGSYYESVLINKIPGSSASNSVTFQSQSLDSNLVVLDTSWDGTQFSPGYTLRINGASYINFRKMTITNYTSYVGYYDQADVIELGGGANHITIESNLLLANFALNSFAGTIIGNDLNSMESHNLIRYNLISGASEGIYFAGTGLKSGYEIANRIIGNIFDSSSYTGIFGQYEDSMQILGNNMFFQNDGVGIDVENSGKSYPTLVANNFITLQSYSYFGMGIYGFDNYYVNFYYNSINLTASSSGYGSYYASIFGATSVTSHTLVKNNIFNCDNGGYSIFGSTMGLKTSDYNDIYSPYGSALASWEGNDCLSLSDWQSYSGMDNNSVSADPAFFDPSNGDLHLTDTSSGVIGMGIPISAISTDINNQPRNSIHTCMGADEYIADSSDAGVTSIISPLNHTCGSANVKIILKVHNFGTQDIRNGFDVFAVIKNFTVNDTGKITIPPFFPKGKDTVVTISFTPLLNTLGGGLYKVIAYTSLKPDGDRTNDSIHVSDSFYNVPVAAFGFKNACLNSVASFYDSSSGLIKITKYSWDFGNGLSATTSSPVTTYSGKGSYLARLKITNAKGCSDSTTKTIKVDSIYAAFSMIIDTSINSVLFKASDTSLYSYSWDFGDVTTGSGYKTSHIYNMGKYKIVLTAQNSSGCTNTSMDTVHFLSTGISGNPVDFGFSVYPNPVRDIATIEYKIAESRNVKIELYDLTGRLVSTLADEFQSSGNHKEKFVPTEYNATSGVSGRSK